ncbi:MAG: tetratricopeptide repeat protein [bacterium]|nr:tetratricopeptide repeat protein [bacterium]
MASAVALVVFLGLFWLLRAQTHYLGDGYQLLSRLSSGNPIIKPWNFGGIAIPLWLSSLLGDRSEAGVRFSYQVISVTAGMGCFVAAFVAARRLFSNNLDRLLFVLGVMTGGTSLLFFGYLENYAFFVLAVFIFALVGLLAARGEVSRFWVLPWLALAVFFHLFGVILIPAAVYLLISDSRLGDWTAARSAALKTGAGIAAALILAVVFWKLCTSHYFLRFALVPFVTDRYTVEGYTLLSMKHIVDWLNLWILLLPGILIALPVLYTRSGRKALSRRDYRFLLIMLACCAAAVFVLDPKLGMPRDWDLFSFAGVPLVVLAFYALLDPEQIGRGSRTAAVLVMFLGLLVLLPRVYAQTDYKVAEAHLSNYFAHDRAKNVAIKTVWISHLKALGHKDRGIAETRKMRMESPEIDLADSAWALVRSGQYLEAMTGFRRVVELNPMKANSWAGIGHCFGEMGQPDSALEYLYISDALSPYRWVASNYLAHAYYRLHEYDSAQYYWRRALWLDSSLLDPLMGLGTMYARQHQVDKYSEIFFQLAVREDVPVKHVVDQIGTYLKLGDVERGRRAFKIALERGADSSVLRSLVKDYPELSDLID